MYLPRRVPSPRWWKRRSPLDWRRLCQCSPRPASPALTIFPGAPHADRPGESGDSAGEPVTAGHSAVATQASRASFSQDWRRRSRLTGKGQLGRGHVGQIVAPAGGVAPSDLAALCGGMGGGPMARHMGDGAMHRRVVEGGQLPVRPELL